MLKKTLVLTLALVCLNCSFSRAESARADRKFGLMLQCFFDSLGIHGGYHWTEYFRTTLGVANSNSDENDQRSTVWTTETRFIPIPWMISPFVGAGILYNSGPASLRNNVAPGVHPMATIGLDFVFNFGLYLAYTHYYAFTGKTGSALHIGYFF